MNKADHKMDIRQSIFEDVRGHLEQWPEYLFEFEGRLSRAEIQAEIDKAIRKLRPDRS